MMTSELKRESRDSIVLGSTAKDKITGFEGIVTAVTHWQTGCTRYGLLSIKLDREGKVREEEWFDEERLTNIPTVADVGGRKAVGGPPVKGVETG